MQSFTGFSKKISEKYLKFNNVKIPKKFQKAPVPEFRFNTVPGLHPWSKFEPLILCFHY